MLDADNSLHPKAVEQCLRVASYADEKIAIVHPLIERLHENEAQGDRTTLISGLSWQESQLLHGNYIDAMALVRKKSWESVSGYSHIEDGWEDYDFWCKLIEAGFQGVLCPQVLAAYICHERSMIANRTDRNVRQISRSVGLFAQERGDFDVVHPRTGHAIHTGSGMGAVAAPDGWCVHAAGGQGCARLRRCSHCVLTAHGERHVVGAGAQHLQRRSRAARAQF